MTMRYKYYYKSYLVIEDLKYWIIASFLSLKAFGHYNPMHGWKCKFKYSTPLHWHQCRGLVIRHRDQVPDRVHRQCQDDDIEEVD